MKQNRIKIIPDLILLICLVGCTASQPSVSGVAVATSPPVQAEATPGPTPIEIADQNVAAANSICIARYPVKRGNFFQGQSCFIAAYRQYVFPFLTDHQSSVETEAEKKLLAGAYQIDTGAMSQQDWATYVAGVNKMIAAKLDEDDDSDNAGAVQPSPTENSDNAAPAEPIGMQNAGALQNVLNYDTEMGNAADVANDQRAIAVEQLQGQQQTLINDKNNYVTCAGLNAKDLDKCAPQKIAFQTDLATYQATAASIPQAPQSTSQPSTDNLQQEDIQDDLDGIAGGVMP